MISFVAVFLVLLGGNRPLQAVGCGSDLQPGQTLFGATDDVVVSQNVRFACSTIATLSTAAANALFHECSCQSDISH